MIERFELGGLDARVHLVWLLAVLALLAWRAMTLRRRALSQFGIPLTEQGRVARRRFVRLLLFGAGIVACLFAALQPRANPRQETAMRKARDLVVCLDVSRSMLADDLKPNRLEHAKLELARLADRLEDERIGLVVFAGEASVRCPLTSNYSYFETAVRNVSPRDVGQGGTHIGDAIRKALSDLLGHDLSGRALQGDEEGEPQEASAGKEPETLPSAADLLIITDGEDHDSYPAHAAGLARELGVGVFAVGLGSREGRLLEGVSYKGQPVRTKLEEGTLTEVVSAAGRGAYLPASTDHFDLVDFYERAMEKNDTRLLELERLVWTEVYQPFLILGLVLLFASRAFPLSRSSTRLVTRLPALPQAAGAALVLLLCAPAVAQAEERSAFARGNEAFLAGDHVAAATAYEELSGEDRLAVLARFNAGVARRSLGELEAAIGHFEFASVRGSEELQRNATYLLAACHLDAGLKQVKAPANESDVGAEEKEPETPEDALKRLGAAAVSMRAGLDFFRRITPREEREDRAIEISKVRLRQALDAMFRIAEAQAEAEAQQALKDPGRFLLSAMGQVRQRRRAFALLEELSPRQRRVPARRLARAEMRARELYEKLAFGLEQEPAAPQPGQPQPSPQQTELMGRAREMGAKALRRAIEASKQVEVSLRGLAPADATPSASRQIEGLREALVAFPLDLAAITADLVAHQREVASLLEQKAFLPKEQEEVAFLTQVYQGVQPQEAAQPGAPSLDAETAGKIREAGAAARAAGEKSYALLQESKPEEAKPHAEECLKRLEELQELLPKPPPSLEDKIKELLAQERETRGETDALQGLQAETRQAEASRLAEAQETHAQRAEELSGEARAQEQQQREGAGEAAGHLTNAAGEARAARGALEQDQREPALEATDRTIEQLEKALEALRGKDREKQQGQPQQQQQQQQQEQEQEKEKEKENQEAKKLDPQEARRLMEKMDDERRKEEARLFPGGSGRAVDKDW